MRHAMLLKGDAVNSQVADSADMWIRPVCMFTATSITGTFNVGTVIQLYHATNIVGTAVIEYVISPNKFLFTALNHSLRDGRVTTAAGGEALGTWSALSVDLRGGSFVENTTTILTTARSTPFIAASQMAGTHFPTGSSVIKAAFPSNPIRDVSFWIRWYDDAVLYVASCYNLTDSVVGYPDWSLHKIVSTITPYPAFLRLGIYKARTSNGYQKLEVFFPGKEWNVWHHIRVVLPEEGGIKLFIDGVLSGQMGTELQFLPPTADHQIRLNRFGRGSTTTSANYDVYDAKYAYEVQEDTSVPTALTWPS